jgi:hypothetical protein
MADSLQQKIELLLSLSEDPKSKAQLAKFLKSFDQVQKAVDSVQKSWGSEKGATTFVKSLEKATGSTREFFLASHKLHGLIKRWPDIQKQLQQLQQLKRELDAVKASAKNMPDVAANVLRTMNALNGGEKKLPFMKKYTNTAQGALMATAAMQNLAPVMAIRRAKDAAKQSEDAEKKRLADAAKEAKEKEKVEKATAKQAEKQRQADERKARNAERIRKATEEVNAERAIKAAEKAEQKAREKTEKAALKAEEKRVKDAERATANATAKAQRDSEREEKRRLKAAEKAEEKRIKDAAKAAEKEEKKRNAEATAAAHGRTLRGKAEAGSSWLGGLSASSFGGTARMFGGASNFLGNVGQFGLGTAMGGVGISTAIAGISTVLKTGFSFVTNVLSNSANFVKGIVDNILVKIGAIITVVEGAKQILEMIRLGNAELVGQFKTNYFMGDVKSNPQGRAPADFDKFLDEMVLKTTFKRNDIREASNEMMAFNATWEEVKSILPVAASNLAARGRDDLVHGAMAYAYVYKMGLFHMAQRLSGIRAIDGESPYDRNARFKRESEARFGGKNDYAKMLGQIDMLGKIEQLIEGIKQAVGAGMMTGAVYSPLSKATGMLGNVYSIKNVSMVDALMKQRGIKPGDTAGRSAIEKELEITDVASGKQRPMNFWEYATRKMTSPLAGMFTDKEGKFSIDGVLTKVKDMIFQIIPQVIQFFLAYEITKWQMIIKLLMAVGPQLISSITSSIGVAAGLGAARNRRENYKLQLAATDTEYKKQLGLGVSPESRLARRYRNQSLELENKINEETATIAKKQQEMSDNFSGTNVALSEAATNARKEFSADGLKQTALGAWFKGLKANISSVAGPTGAQLQQNAGGLWDLVKGIVYPQAANISQQTMGASMPQGANVIMPNQMMDPFGNIQGKMPAGMSPSSANFWFNRTRTTSMNTGQQQAILRQAGFEPNAPRQQQGSTNIPASVLTVDQLLNMRSSGSVVQQYFMNNAPLVR